MKSRNILMLGLLAMGLAGSSALAEFDPSAGMIIHYDFDGDVLNKATGPSSAGTLGDGVMIGFEGDPGPAHIKPPIS